MSGNAEEARLDQVTAKVADTVRANPVPIFAGVLGLVIVIRLVMRRRNP